LAQTKWVFVEAGAEVLAQDGPRLAAGKVVALDHRDARRRQAEVGRQALDDAGRAVGVGRAEIADDGDAVGHAVGEHGAQFQLQQRLVTELRVGAPRQLLRRERAFGQVLEDQRSRPSALDQRAHHGRRRIRAVTGKTGAATHRQCLHVVSRVPAATLPEPRMDVNACEFHDVRSMFGSLRSPH
jgi:hypothetical protein